MLDPIHTSGIEFRGVQKTTLIDFPDEVACTLFLGGCNFRCFYCFNPDLVFNKDAGIKISEAEALEFLTERRSFLDGVCLTGGEPLMAGPELIAFLGKVKALGYKIKIDTNGAYPEVLQEMIDKKLIDYIAMDIKAPLGKYSEVAGVAVDLDKIKSSVELIKQSGLKHEFRTTVFSGLTLDDFEAIGKWLSGSQKYCLQRIKLNQPLVDEARSKEFEAPSLEYIKQIANKLAEYFSKIEIRS
ncbi:anaerobic ribonucleoside-triphosphate reductase activating protein [Candidatus Margulisiibacteriota bacterium]